MSAIKTLDALSICVPTPLRKTKDPDMSYIVASIDAVSNNFRKGQLIVLESTTYPGTTDEVVLPVLEKAGGKVGQDFFLAFSPERVDPGNEKFQTQNIPKIIGGITRDCSRAAGELYRSAVATVIPVSSARVAEMIKLLENTFRAVNIALVNEIAILCNKMGLDAWEVIDGAATKPFGFMPFYPGPGIGGHCLPIDPLYLSWKARHFDFETRFIDLEALVNGHMPHHVVDVVMQALNTKGKALKNAKILLLGVAYKRDVDDVRESPALDIWKLLNQKGAKVSYHDPYVPVVKVDHVGGRSVKLSDKLLKSQDCVLIVTDHQVFDYANIVRMSPLVVDTRNAARLVKNGREKIMRI